MKLLELNRSIKTKKMKSRIDWNGDVPHHIAIMMDGNGRWATRKGLPRTAGHYAGMQTMRETIRICKKIELRYLTLYAFSTENWKRPKDEVDYIIGLINEFVTDNTMDEMNQNNIKIHFIGDISKFTEETQAIMKRAMETTHSNDGMTVNFAVNYGGRSEIVQAVKTIVASGKSQLSLEEFEQYLYTSACPSPELIIRTSGELRLSGFLLWQSAHSELWFTDEMWPSFNEHLLYSAIYDYQRRKQRQKT